MLAVACSTADPPPPEALDSSSADADVGVELPPPEEDTTPPPPPANVWLKTFGTPVSDEGWGIDAAPDGGVFVATHQDNPLKAVVYRLSAGGSVMWTSTWGEAGITQAFIVHAEPDVVYVGGYVVRKTFDAFVLALDPATGKLIGAPFVWDQGFGYEEIDGIVVDGDDVYVSGWTTGEKSAKDVLLMHLTRDLQLVDWTGWGTDDFDVANGHLVADDGRLYVAGRYGSPSKDLGFPGGDAFVGAFEKKDLTNVWHTEMAALPPKVQDAYGLATDGERLFALGIDYVANHSTQIAVWAVEKDGKIAWVQTWGGPADEVGRAIALDPTDGSLLAAVNTRSSTAEDVNVALLRFQASDGAVLSSDILGGGGDDVAHDLVPLGKEVAIVGETTSLGAGKTDAFVLRAQHNPPILPGPSFWTPEK